MTYEQILYGVHDRIATITSIAPRAERLDAPHGPRALRGLPGAAPDDEVRVIVVTGAGRGFCAGADMQNLREIQSGDAGTSNAASSPIQATSIDPRRSCPSTRRSTPVRLSAEHPQARARGNQRSGGRLGFTHMLLLRHSDRLRPGPFPRPRSHAAASSASNGSS